MRRTACVQAILILMLGIEAASAQTLNQQGQKIKEVVYDHASVNDDLAYMIFATAGETIRVKILNTCPPAFDLAVEEVKQALTPPAGTQVTCELADAKPVDIVTKPGIGLYKVLVTKKASVERPQVLLNNESVTLEDVVIHISVEERAWDFEMAGAFTTSMLTDPKFGIRMQKDPNDTDPSAAEKPFVVRDKGADDEARLGVAAFIHLFRPIHPNWAATFGLGINNDNKTTYFTGLSYRFSDAGAFTVGYNWGSVSRLPAGTDASRPVAADFMTKLESRIKGDLFFALSYRFLNPSGRLDKPFQTVPASSGGTASGGSGAGTGSGAGAGAGTGAGSGTGAGGTGSGSGAGTGSETGSGAGTGSGTGAGEGNSGNTPPSVPAPPKLQTITSTCNSVTLTWEPVAGASYRVFRGNSNCNDLREIQRGIQETTFIDNFVVPGRQLHYAVRSDNGLQSNLSECKAITIPACPNNQ